MESKQKSSDSVSVVMIGYSGAVGGEVLKTLAESTGVKKITLLGRKEVEVPAVKAEVDLHLIDILDSNSYLKFLKGASTAVCTLGVGQPTKVSREELVRIDRDAVVLFAKACKENGIKHFQLLGSVSASANSPSFYLKTKGQLIKELENLGFERLSVFQPCMIITPTNRYDFAQAVMLKLWPALSSLLRGGLTKYRGISVDVLGSAIAANVFTKGQGTEILHWNEFISLNQKVG
jgi:uncharacterized protein YbjT (DUF2867 family)